MLEFIKHWMPLLDAFAKFAGIVAVCGLWFAYRQYKLAVKNSARTEERAAVVLAASESKTFGTEIVPEILKLRKGIADAGCKYLDNFKTIHRTGTLDPDTTAVTEDDRKKLEPFNEQIAVVLNSIEGFAIPFVMGVAEDKVGFLECGASFVRAFESNFPLYSRHDLKIYYRSTQTLYFRWKERLELLELQKRQAAAAKEFFSLSAQVIDNHAKSKSMRMAARFFQSLADRANRSA